MFSLSVSMHWTVLFLKFVTVGSNVEVGARLRAGCVRNTV